MLREVEGNLVKRQMKSRYQGKDWSQSRIVEKEDETLEADKFI